MLMSGSLPMSSALTASTIEEDSCLVSTEVAMLARMPVTRTASRVVVCVAPSVSSAGTCWASTDKGVVSAAAHASASRVGVRRGAPCADRAEGRWKVDRQIGLRNSINPPPE